MFKDLDPVLHSQLRLAIISLLMSNQEAEFTAIKEQTNATSGNLSVQINKLREAGYIEVIKEFKDNYPHTLCKITPEGAIAFNLYIKSLQSYLPVKGKENGQWTVDNGQWRVERLE
ncbi:MAG: transcriptional regulator [Bacteroidota bacterium]|nr:transcriptional regulator [Bacteroidota bacterium]MDP4211330.1 transcriptional regulator [Bacteroidota bacterium]